MNNKWDQAYGIFQFYISFLLVISAFLIDSYIACLLFIFIVPIFYGTHEAIHNNLLFSSYNPWLRDKFNKLSGILGSSLQLMNFFLIKQSHLQHHKHGRASQGYAPDIINKPPGLFDYLIYYYTILGGPAFMYQIAGFAICVLPVSKLRFDFKFSLKNNQDMIWYYFSQTTVAVLIVFFIIAGGWLKFFIFIFILNFIWSILQNVSHYGMIGVDEFTDLVCGNSYLLEKPFKFATYGSTSHVAHHTKMNIPGLRLYDHEILMQTEKQLGGKLNYKYGIFAYAKDVLCQLKGPIHFKKLSSSWISLPQEAYKLKGSNKFKFGYQKGRKWFYSNIGYHDENKNTNF